MMVSIAIMGIMAAALSTLGATVQMANQYATEQGVSTQHARVLIERIQRNIAKAHANETFPGVVVIPYTSGGKSFPQALVIWEPESEAASPDGSPTLGELIIYASDPASPNRLLEITFRESTAAVPGASAYGDWRIYIQGLIDSEKSRVTEITNLIRVGKNLDSDRTEYSTLRFDIRHSPSDSEFTDYDSANLRWDELSWALGISGSNSGLRQTWCRFEFQIMPTSDTSQHRELSAQAVPYFGSAAIYYQVDK